MNNLFTLSILLTALLFSCQDPCEDEPELHFSFENEFSCTDSKVNLRLPNMAVNEIRIIKSEDQFQETVEVDSALDCYLAMNYEMFDVVIGKRAFTSSVSSIDYDISTDCETGNYNVKVIYTLGELTVLDTAVFHMILPTLGDDQTVFIQTITQ